MNTALALTLLHFTWEGAGIALTLFVSLRITRSASTRYVIACTAMLAMVVAFGATLVHYWPHIAAPPLRPPEFVWRFAPPNGDLPAASQGPMTPPWWLTPVWVLGASLFSLRSLASWLATQRLRRVGVCLAPEPWQQRVRELAAVIRVTRPVALLESCLTQGPVVIGCLRPVILFPAGLLAGLPAEQVEYFLIHELAHIRRWDYLVNLLQTAAENLLFYHPAVWWVSSVIRKERENCCDDAVATLGNAREFAAALASLEENRGGLVQPALAVTGGSLTQRVRRLLGKPEPRRGAIAPVLLAGAAAVAFAVAMGGPQEERLPKLSILTPKPPKLLAQARSKNPPASTEPDVSSPETPYQKWLNQEVVYIITDEERKAFKSLQTDEEQQQFIEQFWLRRDPTPNTPVNEMREEHYRRIAYANQNLSSSTVPGWKTDRGMIYIKYGPPDERETLAEANPPSDVWQYRFIQWIGTNVRMEFVDESRTGEYHMTKDPSAAAAPEKPLAVAQLVGPGGRGGSPSGTVSVRAQVAGTFIAVHVADGQFVTRGQILVDLQSNDPAHNRIVSPVEGYVKDLSATAGSHVDAGQQLMTIVPRDQSPSKETPISYFEAEMKSLQYQAGFESGYILTKRPAVDFNDPAVKPLSDATRELSRAAQQRSPDAQAALERLRIAVENARAARLGTTAPNNSSTQAPWWAPDPQNAAALAQAIELTAKIQKDGTAAEVTVLRSNDTSLNQSAIQAVQGWRFPVISGGLTPATYTVRVFVDPSKLARR